MLYLFGDSTPFPLPFDFLRTLEAFMVAGTRIVLLDHQARALADEKLAARKERVEGLGALVEMHQSVLSTLSGPEVPDHPFGIDYAKRLTEHAVKLVQERRQRIKDADDAEEAEVRAERERANQEIVTHLRTFFRVARLPTLGVRLTTVLSDGRPDAQAFLTHPGGIGASFTLSTAKSPAWAGPRKLSELVSGVELNVGIKKSFFGGKISLEPVRLDDWVIGSATLDEASATIAVRKKPDQRDTLIFKLWQNGGALSATVEHPGDPNASMVSPAAEAADVPHLERLWSALTASFAPILEERAAVTRISLDGDDVFEQGLGKKLVERLVTILSPVALEVARRSPNARELSLKLEGEGGRREELYLKRDDLLGMLQPLPRGGREVFAPLGLDDWVPATTLRPPEAASAPVRAELSSPIRAEELLSIDLEEA